MWGDPQPVLKCLHEAGAQVEISGTRGNRRTGTAAHSRMHSAAQTHSTMHSPALPSSAPAALGDWDQFLIKEGFSSNAQGRSVNKIELPENLQD